MSFKHVIFRSNLFKPVILTCFFSRFPPGDEAPVDPKKPSHGVGLSDESLQVPWQQLDSWRGKIFPKVEAASRHPTSNISSNIQSSFQQKSDFWWIFPDYWGCFLCFFPWWRCVVRRALKGALEGCRCVDAVDRWFGSMVTHWFTTLVYSYIHIWGFPES